MGSLRVTVPLSQIRASGTNPREDMGDIDRLAESIEATGGEPINPPVVVMDGGAYRLVDGERRFRALCRLYEDDESHLVTVLAYDDYDEAMSAVAMLATDEKKTLTDEERARGTQTVLKLDVPEEQAAKALHVGVEGVRKARRSRKRLGERAETMSMADLLVFAQEDWTAPEMEQLMKAQASNYDTVEGCAKRIMSHRRAEERFQGMVDILGDIEFEDVPRPAGWETLLTATSAKVLREGLDALEDGHEGLKAFRVPYNENALCVCQEPESGAETDTDRRTRMRREAQEAVERAQGAMNELARSWVRGLTEPHVRSAGLRQALSALAMLARDEDEGEMRLAEICEEADVDVDELSECDAPSERELLLAVARVIWCPNTYSGNLPCSEKWSPEGVTLEWKPAHCCVVADLAREMRQIGATPGSENVEWLLEQCREHRDE